MLTVKHKNLALFLWQGVNYSKALFPKKTRSVFAYGAAAVEIALDVLFLPQEKARIG